jgi:hypothetical protein
MEFDIYRLLILIVNISGFYYIYRQCFKYFADFRERLDDCFEKIRMIGNRFKGCIDKEYLEDYVDEALVKDLRKKLCTLEKKVIELSEEMGCLKSNKNSDYKRILMLEDKVLELIRRSNS